MNPNLYIGIISKRDMLEVATRESGKTSMAVIFPATGMGVEALQQFLNSCGNPVRLAVAGAAALRVALTLGNVPLRETFIVSSGVASQAVDLALYAELAL
jgi:hypothetical protein